MKRVLYTGSFDPITNGHLDLINRASKLCDELVVGVIENKSKIPFFTIEERVGMIKKATSHLKNVNVDSFCGLLADYVNMHEISAVVRGLRATMDFEYEIQMAQMNARLFKKDVETIFLMTSPDYSFISSSMIKEVFSLKGNIKGLVPDVILECMEKKLADKTGGIGK
ncbi:pantetheine-phosphate adenylyltransferase [Sinanaerobacter sp. ZZT-01]|uniref:pantetheine-phosphate adenylyltransferase n=1 Tax=Sinanaerobacter sp. ZZT-01 TaxID=3111540 RepID=UPI002D765B87|nr:pantetheine-phosphate adenylyltransferase [Sinanaerobacter sp. ZZT-01]WRR93062.1 pantetheine-phosphate adenylyltransferase [Sinanaerobacter sp. ZZT-01]